MVIRIPEDHTIELSSFLHPYIFGQNYDFVVLVSLRKSGSPYSLMLENLLDIFTSVQIFCD